MQRLTPQLLTASAKAPDRLRGQCITSALILDADRHGHSSRPDYSYHNCYGYGYTRRIRFQSYSRVNQVMAALLPQAQTSFTIIHDNPHRHPRSVYAQMRRRALDRFSRFHLITPLASDDAPLHPPRSPRIRRKPPAKAPNPALRTSPICLTSPTCQNQPPPRSPTTPANATPSSASTKRQLPPLPKGKSAARAP